MVYAANLLIHPEAPKYAKTHTQELVGPYKGDLNFGIIVDRELVGLASLQAIHWGTAELAYEVVPEHRRQGHAGWAAQTLVAYAFNGLGLHEIRATVDMDNTPSQRILTACGLHPVYLGVEEYWVDYKRDREGL